MKKKIALLLAIVMTIVSLTSCMPLSTIGTTAAPTTPHTSATTVTSATTNATTVVTTAPTTATVVATTPTTVPTTVTTVTTTPTTVPTTVTTTPTTVPTTVTTVTTTPTTVPTTVTTVTTTPTTVPTTVTTVTTTPTTVPTTVTTVTTTSTTAPTTETTVTTTPTTATTVTTTPTTKPTSATTHKPVVPGIDVRPGYENVDFGGYTFTFASPINTTDGWSDYEVYADEDSTGFLSESIRKRNEILKNNYNCSVVVEDIDNGTLNEDFYTNQNRIDLVLYRYNLGGKANGNYYNFHDLDIDLDKPWWDRSYIEDVTVNGQLYAMLGAFSLTSFDATWVMYFNNTVKENNSSLKNIDFYDLVYNNEWTLDKFYEIVKIAKSEDGDREMKLGTNDVYGFISSSFGIRGLYFGAGQSYLTKTDSKNGTTTFGNAFNQYAVEATDKIIDIYANDATTITDYQTLGRQMKSNKVLFVPELLRTANSYAGKNEGDTTSIDFGILPHPKLSATQENYAHNIDNHMIYMCIPKTCADLTRIAQFIDLYAYHSYYTVYQDYIEYYSEIMGKEENGDMLDIILQSRYFDLAYHFNFASIDGEYVTGVSEGRNPVSEIGGKYGEAIISAANTWKENMQGAIFNPNPVTPAFTYSVTSDTTCKITGMTAWMGEEIVIPESIDGYKVTEIADRAFQYCKSITSITIPTSVTHIGNYAFMGCYGLTRITYQGTRTEWNAITKGTKWNQVAYKLTCQKTEPSNPVETGKFIAFIPAGNTSTAINLTTGKSVGAISAAEGIVLKGGYLYVASADNGNITAITELGAVIENKRTTMGSTNVFADGRIGLKHSSYWMKPAGAAMATYSYNNIDESAMNTAMGSLNIGKFGTITFNDISKDSFSVYFDGVIDDVDFITDYKVNFVYATYDGSTLKPATGNVWTPLAFNQVALRYAACDVALGYRVGTSTALWQEAMRTYGVIYSIQTVDGKYDGVTIQNYNGNLFKSTSIPSQYASALANYIKYTTTAGKTEAQIAKDLEDANAALAAAQKAFDDAVAANASVKALKDAMVAAEAAYTATRQPEYEARLAYETARAEKAANEAELNAIKTEKTNAMNSAKSTYDDAKAAFENAVKANATLSPLYAELVVDSTARNNITNNTPEKNEGVVLSKATLQAVAQVRQTGVDNYKKWAPLYNKFVEEYEKAANVALWTTEQAENGDFSESPLYQAFKDIAEENRAYPTYTYYYDAATATYTIFVTSATQDTAVSEFTSATTSNSMKKLTGGNDRTKVDTYPGAPIIPEEPEEPNNPGEVIPTDDKVVVFVPAGNTSTAINLATGSAITGFEAKEGLELKGGYLYVAYVSNGKTVAYKELGAAVADKKTTMGWTNVFAGGLMKYNNYWMRANGAAMATYKYNGFMNTAALNTAMGEDAAVGKFGTITFTSIDRSEFMVYFDGNKENIDFITDYKVNFVYANYDGSALKTATGSAWTPLAFNQVALRYAACDVALGNEIGTAQALWQEAMRTYGGYASVKRIDDKYNGTTLQDYNGNQFKATSIPSQYAAALANYLKATKEAGKTEAQVKAEFEAAVAALEAAQKAFDDAVEENATVKVLKDAMDAALATLNTQKQVEYEAYEAYQNAYFNTKPDNLDELKNAWLAEAAKIFSNPSGRNNRVNNQTVYTGLQAAYNDAKEAFDDAVEADTTLKALYAELIVKADDGFDSKADLHKTAKTAQDRVDAYKKWAPLYERFMEAYEELANVALWTEEMAEACDFSESPLYKAFKDIPTQIDGKDNLALPTFTYYYNVATQTYTIFVTSATQPNTVTQFDATTTNNNSVVTGQNWLISPVPPEVVE